MPKTAPESTWVVAEVITQYPQAAAVFTGLRMACAGCAMAPFETLAEVAEIYGLKPETLLGAIRRACGGRGGKALRARSGGRDEQL